jgi:hypothetical protein
VLFHGKIAKEFLRLFDIGHFNKSSIYAGLPRHKWSRLRRS